MFSGLRAHTKSMEPMDETGVTQRSMEYSMCNAVKAPKRISLTGLVFNDGEAMDLSSKNCTTQRLLFDAVFEGLPHDEDDDGSTPNVSDEDSLCRESVRLLTALHLPGLSLSAKWWWAAMLFLRASALGNDSSSPLLKLRLEKPRVSCFLGGVECDKFEVELEKRKGGTERRKPREAASFLSPCFTSSSPVSAEFPRAGATSAVAGRASQGMSSGFLRRPLAGESGGTLTSPSSATSFCSDSRLAELSSDTCTNASFSD
mmetsp:Transcript_119772/g.344210  ORF Transcript_119772/g.344210 Transcript_119772/m.344210 type:complete len:259 (-) Transcript_119772:740-1516(-)